MKTGALAGELGFAQPRQKHSERRDFFVRSGELREHCGNIQEWLSQYCTDTSEPTFVEAFFEAGVVPRRNILDVFLRRPFLWLPLGQGHYSASEEGAFARGSS